MFRWKSSTSIVVVIIVVVIIVVVIIIVIIIVITIAITIVIIIVITIAITIVIIIAIIIVITIAITIAIIIIIIITMASRIFHSPHPFCLCPSLSTSLALPENMPNDRWQHFFADHIDVKPWVGPRPNSSVLLIGQVPTDAAVMLAKAKHGTDLNGIYRYKPSQAWPWRRRRRRRCAPVMSEGLVDVRGAC